MVGKYDGHFNDTDGPRYKLVEEDIDWTTKRDVIGDLPARRCMAKQDS